MTFTDEQVQIIQTAMEEGRIPGVSVALVRAGELVASGGFGKRNLESDLPMTAETISSIASLTKSVTGVAVMQLVEQGKLSLDEPVVTYLPEFRVADPEASRKITPRMLLSHKSGMGRTGHQNRVFTEEVSPYKDRADLVSQLATVELQTPPNDSWSYCNEGYVTLGLLIETLSGIPLEEYYRTQIFEPLGLASTHAGFAAWRAAENGTTGYKRTNGGHSIAFLPQEYPVYLSTGGIVSNVLDLAQYQMYSMDYANNPLLSAGSLEQMQTISMPYGDTGWGYGLGWTVSWNESLKVVAHGGGQAGVATYSFMLPALRCSVALITNLSGAKVAQLAEQLAGTLIGRPIFRESVQDRLPIRTRYPQPDVEELSRYTGTWVFGESTLVITLSGEELVAQMFAPDEFDSRPAALHAIGERLFISTLDGLLVRFLANETGEITGMLAGGNRFLRQT